MWTTGSRRPTGADTLRTAALVIVPREGRRVRRPGRPSRHQVVNIDDIGNTGSAYPGVIAMSTAKKEHFALRLTEEEMTALRTFATVTNTSMNDVIRRAIREFLSGDARREEFQAILQDAQDRYSVALEKLADL
jgi:hypothetical protein